MTKINRQESAKAMYCAAMGHFDLVARTMSACIRAARSAKERNELITEAAAYPAILHSPDWII